MKHYSVKYLEGRAYVSVILPDTSGELVKKTVVAENGASLWKAMEFLSKFDMLPAAKRDAITEAFTKQRDRETLEAAMEAWIAAGNAIRVIPRAGAKTELTEAEKSAVMDILASLDIDMLALAS